MQNLNIQLNMKSNFLFVIILFLVSLSGFSSCSRNANVLNSNTIYHNPYKVTKIKKENGWYFIYLQRNDSIFKVVSEEPITNDSLTRYPKIKKNGLYDFELTSWGHALTEALGINPIIAGPETLTPLDSMTYVSLEPENNIWDLYSCPNLRGLYYMK